MRCILKRSLKFYTSYYNVLKLKSYCSKCAICNYLCKFTTFCKVSQQEEEEEEQQQQQLLNL